jgi:hypothetical protein
MTEGTDGVIPSGKHRGKRLTDVSNDILMAMQASWIDSHKLRASSFFAEIQSEVARRGLPVLMKNRPKRGSEASLHQKARYAVEQWLTCKYGDEIPQDELVAARKLLGDVCMDSSVSELA